MKTRLNYYLTTLILLVSQTSIFGQPPAKQSAIYEAIAILNARHGINTILLPDVTAVPEKSAYQAINPLDGKVTKDISGAIPQAFINNAVTSSDIIRRVLARNAGLADNASLATVKEAYENNPFFKSLFNADTLNLVAAPANLAANMTGKYVPSDAGNAFTTILNNLGNGSADFLIKRAGEELSISVFSKLQVFIAHYPEFGVLFPKTTELIKPIAPYDYAKTLNALQTAIQEDLNNMSGNIPGLYPIPRYKLLNEQVPALTLVFSSSKLISELHGKNGLSRSLHDLDTCSFLSAANNYSSFIKVLSLTSDGLRKKSLTDPEGADYNYINFSEINKLTSGDNTNKAELLRYFLGFIYQSSQQINIYNGTGSQTIGEAISGWAKASDTDIASLLDKLTTSAGMLQELADQISTFKIMDAQTQQATGKVVYSLDRFTAYNQALVTAMQLLEPYISTSGEPTPFRVDFKIACDYWPPFSAGSVNLVKDITQKNYSSAVKDLAHLLDVVTKYLDSRQDDKQYVSTLTTALKADLKTKYNTVTNSIITTNQQIDNLKSMTPVAKASTITVNAEVQQLQTSLQALQNSQAQLDWENKKAEKVLFSLSKVIDYYQLFAALSEASNSQQVEWLLETYALPAGSSRVKKETNFNIALNAYVGGYFARGSTQGQGFSNDYGLTAPIGFTFSHGLGGSGSLSLFTGIVDIGSIVQYKLNNQGAYEQDVNLAGLISPSVHFVYGFPFYLPISLGLGCQWTTPATTSSNSIILIPHFNAFLAVDIPLFNLSVVKKKVSQ